MGPMRENSDLFISQRWVTLVLDNDQSRSLPLEVDTNDSPLSIVKDGRLGGGYAALRQWDGKGDLIKGAKAKDSQGSNRDERQDDIRSILPRGLCGEWRCESSISGANQQVH